MKRVWQPFLALICVASSAGIAVAAERAAIVEGIEGKIDGITLFSFLEVGTVLSLPPSATLTLGYLRSCTLETIIGGHLVVGLEQSQTEGGSVTREKVECDGGRMQLTAAQNSKSGGMAFRNSPKSHIYGLSPVFRMEKPGRLRIERVDQAAEPIDLVSEPGVHIDVLLDLGRHGITLVRGGTYRVVSGDREVVFNIMPSAKSGVTPLISRLVLLD